MVHTRSPSQELILPPTDPQPPEEPQIRPDWHTFHFYENPYLSGLYGALGGLLAGGALLGILWYFYGIEFLFSVYIAGPMAVLLLIGMSLSVACRCIVCILVPDLLGKYGRWVLYSLLLAALVSGPVSNISTNMERMSNSMSCSVEMIKNQTKDLQQQFLDPFNNIKEEIIKIEDKIKLYASVIETAMKPITNAIAATASGVKDAANYLKKAADDCKNMFNSAYNSCTTFFSNAYQKCKSAINKIPVIGSLRRKRNSEGKIIFIQDVFILWNEMEDEKHRKFWETRAEEILEETLNEYLTLYPNHKLPVQPHLKEKYLNMTVRRFRRGAVSAICEVVNVAGTVCAPLKLTSGICTPLETISDALDLIGSGLNALYETIKNAFYFNIIKKWYLIGLNDVSKTAAAMVAEIASYFSFHSYIIYTSLSFLTKWTSLLLILMLLQSALYLQHYLTQIDFDNNYISLNFRRFDRDCRRLGRPSALPLQKNETSQYISTATIALNGTEIKKSILSILQLLLNMIFYAVVVFFDYVLYYVVYLVHTYGNVHIDFSGSINIYFAITGDGWIANLLQGLISGINIKDNYYTQYNVTQCLPYPSYPDTNNFYLLLALNGGVLATILLQSYCYRLKRALCGFFYKKREEERIRYLHNKILHHRKFKLQQMKFRLKNSKQERDAQQTLAKLPLIGKIFHDKSHKRSCLHCGVLDEDAPQFYTCSRTSCYADYCENCFNEMGKQCLLCSKKDHWPNQEELWEDSLPDLPFSSFFESKHESKARIDTSDKLPLLQGTEGNALTFRGLNNLAFSGEPQPAHQDSSLGLVNISTGHTPPTRTGKTSSALAAVLDPESLSTFSESASSDQEKTTHKTHHNMDTRSRLTHEGHTKVPLHETNRSLKSIEESPHKMNIASKSHQESHHVATTKKKTSSRSIQEGQGKNKESSIEMNTTSHLTQQGSIATNKSTKF